MMLVYFSLGGCDNDVANNRANYQFNLAFSDSHTFHK